MGDGGGGWGWGWVGGWVGVGVGGGCGGGGVGGGGGGGGGWWVVVWKYRITTAPLPACDIMTPSALALPALVISIEMYLLYS